MQCRYAGDIGDYAGYGLLRALSRGRRGRKRKVGVAWYWHPDEGDGDDGKGLDYLQKPEAWREVDEELFDALDVIVRDERCIERVKASGILGEAVFADELQATDLAHAQQRKEWRAGWFERVLEKVADCDVVFAVPDNGLRDDEAFDYAGGGYSWKSMPLEEAARLARRGSGRGRKATIIYHPNSRFKGGGHEAEIEYWTGQLPGYSGVFRIRRGEPRTYFILNANQWLIRDLRDFVERWRVVERRLGVPTKMRSELITK